MGATITHGNAGYLTYFRNYASSQFAPPAVWGSTAVQTGNVTALQFEAGVVGMNVLGNVLGTDGVSSVYEAYDSDAFAIFQLGRGGDGPNDVAARTLYRHGNYDTVNQAVSWSDGNDNRELPASLYRVAKPAWWPAGVVGPWVGPDLSPMLGALPAKLRSDAMPAQ
jgi:hypothetical protein